MRTLAIILTILTLSSAAFTQTLVPGMDVPEQQQILNINLENVPLKQALQEILKHVNGSYEISPALDRSPYDKVIVSLNVRNANFDDALTNLLRTNGLTVQTGKDRPIIVPVGPGAPQVEQKMMMVPVAYPQQRLDLVTVNIPAMPIKDALALVCPDSGWTFSDGLGKTPMPGARFYQFPRDMAAAIVLRSAGLVPPAGSSRVIANRGQFDVYTNYQYMPSRAQYGASQQPAGYADQGYLYTNQARANNSRSDQEGIAIAAYISGNRMLFTILTNRARDVDLIGKLMTLGGRSYVLGDAGTDVPQVQALAATVQTEGSRDAAPTGQIEQPTGFPSKAISAQLRDVTLEQALDSLLPACHLTYHRVGPANNPTYKIDPMVQTIINSPAAPASSVPVQRPGPPAGSSDNR